MAKAISRSTRIALSRLTEEEIIGVKESLKCNPLSGVCCMCLGERGKGEKVCKGCR